MSYYDNFLNRGRISKIGKLLVNRQNNFYINTIVKNTSKKNLKILEIGPGKGYFAKKCRKFGFQYTGIESNKAICNHLQKQGLNVFNETVPPLNLKTKFDVIVMIHVLEHISDKNNAINLLEQCKNKLNKSGLLIISSPDITFFKEDFFGCDYTHSFPLSLYSLKQVFIDLDLQVKFADVRVLTIRGSLAAKFVQVFINLLYNLGLIGLFFGEKAYKVKNLGHASCTVVGFKK